MSPRLSRITNFSRPASVSSTPRVFFSSTTPTQQDRSDAASSLLRVGGQSGTGTRVYRPPALNYNYMGGQTGANRDFERQRAERAERSELVEHERQAMRQKAMVMRANIEYLRQMPRKWIIGDVYAPHDLSADEMRKNKKSAREPDLIDLYKLHPLDMYKNFSFLSYYMTPGGSIQHPNASMLRPVNQRKVAKAIRRAIGMGIQPSVHRHPEILKEEFRRQSNWWNYTVMRKGNIWK